MQVGLNSKAAGSHMAHFIVLEIDNVDVSDSHLCRILYEMGKTAARQASCSVSSACAA